MAQVDELGNLDVSLFNGHLAGAGGFIGISQNTQRLVFMGTFCAGHLDIQVESGQVKINREAGVKKFINKVEQITFNGAQASIRKQSVLFVTERCVFRLIDSGLELVEIAPGLNLDHDILGMMDFHPTISTSLKLMDSRIFSDEPMNMRESLIHFHAALDLHIN